MWRPRRVISGASIKTREPVRAVSRPWASSSRRISSSSRWSTAASSWRASSIPSARICLKWRRQTRRTSPISKKRRNSAPASRPELPGGAPRALGKRRELGPDDVGIDRRLADPGAVAAVASRDHILAPHELGVASDALRDQLGVLDEVRFGLNHPGYQHLAGWELHALE